ncbi:MAG TPA: hypothetical protein VN361_11155 [Oxalicibacterium sp.]|nr:hypothetical protein [Oxalicibacterium sp.]
MRKARGGARLMAIDLIEEQLRVLPVSIATILQSEQVGDAGLAASAHLMLKRKRRASKTGSAGNIVADCAPPETSLNLQGSLRAIQASIDVKNHYLRVVISNALLAVGMFFRQHNMAEMRTPEMQFLGHVINAILNANTFKVETGYIPIAAFDGLVITADLNGALLFGDGNREGFMEFGDAIALLQWLSRYLRGESEFISWGDAG